MLILLNTEKAHDYCGNYVYEDGALERIITDNGYIDRKGAFYAYIKDYQGNNRVTVRENGASSDVTDYYPYGMPFSTFNGNDRYKYSGKELDTTNGLNLYDFDARQQDIALGQFTAIDPLASDYANISPYTYCAGNPVNRIDPDGRADFLVGGKVIGSDGIDDQRILTLRTESLTKTEVNETTKFIKSNSGKSDAFQNNGIAYTNSIAIESSADNRQAMVTEVSKDSGKGGKSEANNREYGGSIENSKIVVATPGAVANPKTNATASIELSTGVSTFHSHPSGTVVESPSANTLGGSTTTYSFIQTPSSTDINNAGTNSHYVFGRSSGKVYIYNSQGIQAIIPMKRFVNPQR